ncbi:hypothetical protein [Sphingomonas sp. LaA6.9]|uniref:hypothetical protein n=1 Tax=Sphingomonas sp. LaA6.9 TaxID=2919914 RepID=UPI001F50306A|nr:hypothetical protein [Sphingomonas sp. LaA6.9]MCJ8159860.1 hypothetical protein [Sphingomonas sp. LaA6.9]
MADVAQIAGNIVGGVANYEMGKYNRASARVDAINAERDGVADEARIRDAARIAMGQQMGAQAENGFQPGTGSALDALQQSAINATLDALTARRQAAARARSRREEGDIAYAAGENALVQGMMGAASAAYQTREDWAAARSGSSAPKAGGG